MDLRLTGWPQQSRLITNPGALNFRVIDVYRVNNRFFKLDGKLNG